MKFYTLFFAFFSITITSFSQTFKANLKDLDFMAGKWTLKHEWGDMEENWSAPMGNCIMCSYRCVKNDSVLFYEFIVIEQTDSVPVMKLRHFSAGNIAWEDKNSPHDYPLIQMEQNKAVFERPDKKTKMTYERISQKQFTVTLEREGKNGKRVTDVFNYELKE